MTSPLHLHTQARVQPRNTYNHTYIKFCLDKKTSHTKSRQNNLHYTCSVDWTSNKEHCTTHGNAPKGFGSYLTPKTHIHHTHSPHLSTRTQTSTNTKITLHNRMRYTEGDTRGHLQCSHKTGVEYASSI